MRMQSCTACRLGLIAKLTRLLFRRKGAKDIPYSSAPQSLSPYSLSPLFPCSLLLRYALSGLHNSPYLGASAHERRTAMPQNPPRTQSLASCYENAFTIILRLSGLNQQAAANSQDFRTSIRAALKAAMEQAKALGYSSESNQLAFFAVVSLLDERVLKLQSPAF